MSPQPLTVRPLERHELNLVVDYFHSADERFLRNMGVDPLKLIPREEWIRRITGDWDKPFEEKETFYLGWNRGTDLVGHSNLNMIQYGEAAHVHLHLWKPDLRKNGMGAELFRMGLYLFAKAFRLKKIICEPYAENPAPNSVLQKAGFEWIKTYDTTPGAICFPQPVNRYEWDCRTAFLDLSICH